MKTSLVDRASVERLLLLVGAIRAGLIDALASGDSLSAEQVARKAGTDLRATRTVLEALVAEGIAEHSGPGMVAGELEDPAGAPAGPTTGPGAAPAGAAMSAQADAVLYRLAALGRAHLVDEGPELERSGLLHQVNKLRGWLQLPEVIRTGKAEPWDEDRRGMRDMVAAMGERDPATLDEIRERCLDYSGPIRTMLDAGGAVGHVARHFARRGVQATLLDRETVIPVAREFLGEEGAPMTLIAGDFTKGLPPGPFDLVYLGNVTHVYSPSVNARLVREVYAVLSQGGTIAIQDHVWGRSRRAAMFAVNMLQATADGGVWTESQYRQWLEAAGFASVETLDLEATGAQLILGRKPRVQTESPAPPSGSGAGSSHGGR